MWTNNTNFAEEFSSKSAKILMQNDMAFTVHRRKYHSLEVFLCVKYFEAWFHRWIWSPCICLASYISHAFWKTLLFLLMEWCRRSVALLASWGQTQLFTCIFLWDNRWFNWLWSVMASSLTLSTHHPRSFKDCQKSDEKWWIVWQKLVHAIDPTHEPIIFQNSLASGWNGQTALFFGILWSISNDDWTVLKHVSLVLPLHHSNGPTPASNILSRRNLCWWQSLADVSCYASVLRRDEFLGTATVWQEECLCKSCPRKEKGPGQAFSPINFMTKPVTSGKYTPSHSLSFSSSNSLKNPSSDFHTSLDLLKAKFSRFQHV